MAWGAQRLRGRTVRIRMDNTAGEQILLKRSGRRTDHNWLAHEIWTIAYQIGAGVWFERVDSESSQVSGRARNASREAVCFP